MQNENGIFTDGERARYVAQLKSFWNWKTRANKKRAHAPLLGAGKHDAKLLQFINAKTVKGEKLGYLTGILYLAPSNESGVIDTCPKATDGCRADCLYLAGRGRFTEIQDARTNKTLMLANNRAEFERILADNIRALVARAARLGLKPAVRVNGTSDLPSIARNMARLFPDVQFYDYTKLPKAWTRILPNYHLTFSRSENNGADVFAAIENGINVAVVFDTMRGKPLPATWRGVPVIDGDAHDLRFLDGKQADGRGFIVGLHAKGTAIYARNSFTVKDSENGRAAILEARQRAKDGKQKTARRLGAILQSGRGAILPDVSRAELARLGA